LHTGKKPFACKHCKQVFRSKNRLEKHEIVREPKQTRKIESLKCEFCDKLFNRPEHRRNHVKQVHEEEMPFKCEQCSKAFKEQAALQKHIYVLHTGKKTICM
jgi:KRAB domain-containing zinc finger protein